MRRPFIAGNWKMHKTVAEATSLARDLVTALKGCGNRLMIAPPFTSLPATGAVIEGSNIILGAQNMGPEREGAHTGETSVLMLKDLGVEVVILGHSERRHTYGETDQLINQKVLLALSESIEVILCVGETIEQREAGKVELVVGSQLAGGLSSLDAAALKRVTIAYEPVWAIGTGKTATPNDADAVHRFIRTWLSEHYDTRSAESMVIQYGGSVKPGNVSDLMTMDNIDGALVGGASLSTETFVPIARFNE